MTANYSSTQQDYGSYGAADTGGFQHTQTSMPSALDSEGGRWQVVYPQGVAYRRSANYEDRAGGAQGAMFQEVVDAAGLESSGGMMFVRTSQGLYLPTTTNTGQQVLVKMDSGGMVRTATQQSRDTEQHQREWQNQIAGEQQYAQQQDEERRARLQGDFGSLREIQTDAAVSARFQEEDHNRRRHERERLDREQGMRDREQGQLRDRYEGYGETKLYEVRKFHRYRECSVGNDLVKIPHANLVCFGLGTLGVLAATFGKCHGFGGAPEFCAFSGLAYLGFGMWLTVCEWFPTMVESGFRATHILMAAVWCFQWVVEAVWSADLLSSYAGHDRFIDKGLFGDHNTAAWNKCAHEAQEYYILLAFTLAMIKMVLEKITIRFDWYTTEYRRTFRYRELPPPSSYLKGSASAHDQLYQAAARANLGQVECETTGEIFATEADFQLHANRMTVSEMSGFSDDDEYIAIHVSQPLYYRFWFSVLCAGTSVFIVGLSLADLDVKHTTGPVAFNLTIATYFGLLSLYTFCQTFFSNSEQIEEAQQRHNLGWLPLITTVTSLVMVVAGLISQRLVMYHSRGQEARAAAWLAILLSLLQLIFVKVKGNWAYYAFGYQKLAGNDVEGEGESA